MTGSAVFFTQIVGLRVSVTLLDNWGTGGRDFTRTVPFDQLKAVMSRAEVEAKRQALNDWMRASGAYDAVLDFDRLMRDPARPTRMRAEFDSGDHLHPAPAGYRAMADSIDLDLFRGGVPTK